MQNKQSRNKHMRRKSRVERILETVVRSTDATVLQQNRLLVELLKEHQDVAERRVKRKRKPDDPEWIGRPVREEYYRIEHRRYGHDPETKKSLNKDHVKRRGMLIESGLAERIIEGSRNPKPMYGTTEDIIPAFSPSEALFEPGDTISFHLTVKSSKAEDLRYGTIEAFKGWTNDLREIYDVKMENSGVLMTTAFRDGEAQKV